MALNENRIRRIIREEAGRFLGEGHGEHEAWGGGFGRSDLIPWLRHTLEEDGTSEWDINELGEQFQIPVGEIVEMIDKDARDFVQVKVHVTGKPW